MVEIDNRGLLSLLCIKWYGGAQSAFYLKRSKNTKPFHKLCKSIEASKLRDLTNTMPITKPKNVRGSIRCRLKCASANAIALTMIEPHTGKYLVREGNRKPRNMTSSQMGAQTETTTAYKSVAIGSLAIMDCSTCVELNGAGKGRRSRFSCDRRFTSGNIKQPKQASTYHFPLHDTGNHWLARGWNRDRHLWRMPKPTVPSAMSVIRLYRAWPRYVRLCLLKPAAWAAIGIIHEPTNQNAANHKNITCTKYYWEGWELIDDKYVKMAWCDWQHATKDYNIRGIIQQGTLLVVQNWSES